MVSDLVNATEAAAILRVPARQIVERLRKKKGFPKAVRPGKEYLWFKQELQHWLNQQRV